MAEEKSPLEELKKKYDGYLSSINLSEKKSHLNKLEAETLKANLWDNPDEAKAVLQEFADVKSEIASIEQVGEEVNTLAELARQGDLAGLENDIKKAESGLDKLILASFLSGKYDKKNALVSIHAGQGGTEAMDWVSMLYRMYLKYCEARNWETRLVDMTSGEEAGIKSVTFGVQGRYAYGYLKGESGTHRLVRQSPFNADKLRQTSFALVEVLPELEEVDLPDIEIKDEDLDWQFFRSSSQGGQNVQKVSTAVRLTHRPTGLVVTAQSERFQEQNRRNALNLLRAKLWLMKTQEAKATKKQLKGEYRPASWGTQIRSYVLHPYKMVKDLRTGVETANSEAVLDGQIGEFIAAELKLNSKL